MTKDEIKKSIETMICIKAEGARGVWCSESDNAYDSSTYLATEEIEVILQALQAQLEELDGTCKTAYYDENQKSLKVNTIVYKFNPLKTRVDEWVIDNITFGRNNYFGFGINKNGTTVKKNLSDIGDNVFLTKAEAEAKLKEIRGE